MGKRKSGEKPSGVAMTGLEAVASYQASLETKEALDRLRLDLYQALYNEKGRRKKRKKGNRLGPIFERIASDAAGIVARPKKGESKRLNLGKVADSISSRFEGVDQYKYDLSRVESKFVDWCLQALYEDGIDRAGWGAMNDRDRKSGSSWLRGERRRFQDRYRMIRK